MKNLLCLLMIIALVACTQDAYEKGDGEYSQMTAEMGDGYTSSDKKVVRFVTDDGVQLKVSEPFTTNIMPKADTVYRAVFYYNKNGEEAEVKGPNPVGLLRPRRIDSLKTDPVRLESVWMGKSKQYVNLSVYLMVGTADNDSVRQRLACHRDTLLMNADSTRTLCLTLYHDQANMPQYYSQRSYLSIPTKGMGADSVELTVNTYNGVIVKRLKL